MPSGGGRAGNVYCCLGECRLPLIFFLIGIGKNRLSISVPVYHVLGISLSPASST